MLKRNRITRAKRLFFDVASSLGWTSKEISMFLYRYQNVELLEKAIERIKNGRL